MAVKGISIFSQDKEKTGKDKARESTSRAGAGQPAADRDGGGQVDGVVIPESNEDPYRRRLTDPTTGLVKKLIRAAKNKVTPPPTPEEIAAMEDRKRAKLLAATLKREADVAARRLSRALADLNFCYLRRDVNGNITRSRYITFDHVFSSEDAHWLHVNMRMWPHGINSDDVIKQEVINHLSRAVGHKVNVRATAEEGIWYIVERASGMMGIPVHVQLQDMWQRFPPSANGLTIPIGMTNNRKTVFDNLDDMVHVLIAGQTGGGKSTLLNDFLVTLITRNRPEQLRVVLMDMKAGLEFQYYEGLPHLLPIPGVTDTGIIDNPDQVAPALHWIVGKEAKNRLELIRAAGHKDIKSYNARRKHALPRVVVAIDEWAMARMGDGGKDAENELAKAVQLLRAAGIHFIVCTQTPSKDVLGVLVRANLPTRIALGCAELSASMLVVGDGSAVGLNNPGRAIYKRHGAAPVQTPFISEEMVKGFVERIKNGEIAEAQPSIKHDVTMAEMLEWALTENSGSLRYSTIYTHFAHRGIPRLEVQNGLEAIEGQIIEIKGALYRVEPGAGSRPRRLVAVAAEEGAADETI